MSYLVTGGTGFIGSYICRALVRADEKVIAHDYHPTRAIMGEIMTPAEEKQIILVQGDVSDFLQLAHVVQENGVEKIIHMASLLHPDSNLNPSLAEKVNNLGFINVLECSRLLKVKKVVWASSVVVFGPPEMYSEEYIPNDAPHAPTSVYGACKSHCEFLANHYHNTWGIDHIGLRFTIVFGPGRTRGATSFVHKLMIEPALGKPSIVPYGDDIIDWQYVEDIASLVIKCSKIGPTKTQIFNTKFDVRSIRDAGSYVKEIIPNADLSFKPGTFGIAWKLDDTPLQDEIGFTPEHPMERGIIATMNFFRAKAGLPELKG